MSKRKCSARGKSGHNKRSCKRNNPGYTFKKGKAVPHDKEFDDLYQRSTYAPNPYHDECPTCGGLWRDNPEDVCKCCGYEADNCICYEVNPFYLSNPSDICDGCDEYMEDCICWD